MRFDVAGLRGALQRDGGGRVLSARIQHFGQRRERDQVIGHLFEGCRQQALGVTRALQARCSFGGAQGQGGFVERSIDEEEQALFDA